MVTSSLGKEGAQLLPAVGHLLSAYYINLPHYVLSELLVAKPLYFRTRPPSSKNVWFWLSVIYMPLQRIFGGQV